MVERRNYQKNSNVSSHVSFEILRAQQFQDLRSQTRQCPKQGIQVQREDRGWNESAKGRERGCSSNAINNRDS